MLTPASISCIYQYHVKLHSFKAVAFASNNIVLLELQSQKVEIATAFSAGPRPRVYAPNPPSYDDASSLRRMF